MQFEEKYKDLAPGELSDNGCYITSDHSDKCSYCGRMCSFIEINYEAFFCSDECEQAFCDAYL